MAIYGEDSSYGPNQIALLLAALVGGLLGLRHGHRWPALEAAVVRAISVTMPACLILLAVGALIGAWILSGTVPYLILLAAELLAQLVLRGMLSNLRADLPFHRQFLDHRGHRRHCPHGGGRSAGAFAYDYRRCHHFRRLLRGQDVALSETTNLAAAVAEADLFAHIRNMLWTALPALAIALLLFSLAKRCPRGRERRCFCRAAAGLPRNMT